MIIHFFGERAKARVDYFQLIDGFFSNIKGCKISSDEEQVDMEIDMKNFGFSYHYYVTKRSRVTSLYRLNVDYVNTNILVDIPPMIPNYLGRLIFEQMHELCEAFGLTIYYEKFEDIRPFNMFELIKCLDNERTDFIENNKDYPVYPIDQFKLNEMCKYQSWIDKLPEIVKGTPSINPYSILVEKRTGLVKNSIRWTMGEAMIFPPHLDFVQIVNEDNLVTMVSIENFYHYTLRLMDEIRVDEIDFKLVYLNQKAALKAAKLTKKMRKAIASLTDYDDISILNLIEE